MSLKIYFSFLFLIFFTTELASQIFISPAGDDNNTGTIDQPLKTFSAAINKAAASDTIYVRGGVYSLMTTISISKSGSEENKYFLFAYQDEKPLLDFSSMPVSSSNRGVSLSGSYWHIKGLEIKGAGDNGMFVRGSFNIIEFCSFLENKDTGLQLGNGASNNRVINCDSYFNSDPSHGNADGFAAKLDVGTNNYFYGCRAWQNSDDGWDGYLRGADDISTIVENSWCFANGYLKDGSESNGNGNGYKMGGGDDGNAANLANDFTLIKSIAFDNRVKGFDQNNNRGSMTLYNCSAYRNATNYSLPGVINSDETATIINCAVLGTRGSIANHVVQQTNSWLSPFIVTNDDFISIDTTGVRGQRSSDGSLPFINFLRLADGSDLINSGTDIGIPFLGSAPDLGAFEFGETVPVELINFSASVSGNSIILNWTTASELNNYGFEVQKKFVNEFATIGFIPGKGTTTETNQYQFIQDNPGQGINTYRLKQVDFSGSFSYSEEIKINFNIPDGFTLHQNFPNPFNPKTTITFSLPEGTPVSLNVYNSIGELVASFLNNETKEPGTYNIDFDASRFSSGTYIYVLKQGKNILSKKMTLLK